MDEWVLSPSFAVIMVLKDFRIVWNIFFSYWIQKHCTLMTSIEQHVSFNIIAHPGVLVAVGLVSMRQKSRLIMVKRYLTSLSLDLQSQLVTKYGGYSSKKWICQCCCLSVPVHGVRWCASRLYNVSEANKMPIICGADKWHLMFHCCDNWRGMVDNSFLECALPPRTPCGTSDISNSGCSTGCSHLLPWARNFTVRVKSGRTMPFLGQVQTCHWVYMVFQISSGKSKTFNVQDLHLPCLSIMMNKRSLMTHQDNMFLQWFRFYWTLGHLLRNVVAKWLKAGCLEEAAEVSCGWTPHKNVQVLARLKCVHPLWSSQEVRVLCNILPLT